MEDDELVELELELPESLVLECSYAGALMNMSLDQYIVYVLDRYLAITVN